LFDHTGYGNRANSRAKLKKYSAAVSDFDHAMELDPMECYQRDYALFLASCPDAQYRDGRKGVELATRAIKKAGLDAGWAYHAALAAAYAEVGEWEKAVTAQQKALADKSLVGDDRAKMAERLALYRARKPYRDEE
jgi:tetratricopeptide (TPR) repeat protein